jgi:PncC family amidohydrolase
MEKIFDEKIINSIRDFLLKNQETLSIAESVTSGLLQFSISQAPDAALFFQGGITTYNLGQKSRQLNVEPIHAQSCNSVSEKVASEMALNCCKKFTSNWGLGITGYATAVPESENKIFAYYAIAHNGKVVLTKKIEAEDNSPFDVQIYYAQTLLKEFERLTISSVGKDKERRHADY